jgi:hypothetical protein
MASDIPGEHGRVLSIPVRKESSEVIATGFKLGLMSAIQIPSSSLPRAVYTLTSADRHISP